MSQKPSSKLDRLKLLFPQSPRHSKRKTENLRSGFMHQGLKLNNQCIKSKVIKLNSCILDSSIKLSERNSTQTSAESETSLNIPEPQISITLTNIPNLNRGNVIVILKQVENAGILDKSKHILRSKAFNFMVKHARTMLKSDKTQWNELLPSTVEAIIYECLQSSLDKPHLSNEHILNYLLERRGLQTFSELITNEQTRHNEESFDKEQLEPQFEGTVQRTFHKDNLNCYPEFSISGTFWQLKTRFLKSNLLQVTMVHSPRQGVFSKGQILVIAYKVVFEGDFRPTTYQFMPVTVGALWEFVIEEKDISGDLSTAPLKMKVFSKIEPVTTAILMHLALHVDILLKMAGSNLPRSALMVILQSSLLEVNSEDVVLEVIAKWTQENFECMEEGLGDLISCVKWEFVSVEGLLEISRKYSQIKEDYTFRNMFKQSILKHTQERIDSTPRRSYSKVESRKRYSSVKELSHKLSTILVSSQYTPNYKDLHTTKLNRLQQDYSSKHIILHQFKDELCSISLIPTTISTSTSSIKYGLIHKEQTEKTHLELHSNLSSVSSKTTDKTVISKTPLSSKTRDGMIDAYLARLSERREFH